jgi:hypothetical protein
MLRNIYISVAALGVALLIYAVMVGVILNRLVRCGISTSPVLTANRPPSGVTIFGLQIPLSCVIAAAVTMLAMPLIADFMTHLRRQRRARNDQCVDCGYPLTAWRGRCPGCGERIGPG